MIRALHVEQFKSLYNVKLQLHLLRVLIGPNASGKSNIIDALRFLQEAMLTDVESTVARRGGFSNVLFQGKNWGERIIISVDYAAKLRNRSFLRYHVQVAEAKSGRPGVREEFLHRRSVDVPNASTTLFMARWGREGFPGRESLFDTADTGVLGLKVVGFLANHPELRELRTFIESWQFLQVDVAAIRQPQRDQREHRLSASAGNLANVLRTLSAHEPETFDRIVSDLRSLIAQVDELSLQVERGQVNLLLKERGLARALDPLSLSDGTLRLLAMITAVHTIPPGGLLCLEEPEHGLHPLLFGPLLALFRECCHGDEVRQILLTSHSPDLVDAAEADEVVPVERNAKGETVLPALDRRRLKKWLKEFRMGELWRMRQIGGVP